MYYVDKSKTRTLVTAGPLLQRKMADQRELCDFVCVFFLILVIGAYLMTEIT